VGATVRSVFGTLAFLTFSMTIGQRLVFRVIRWTNDHFSSELPEAIGVQTVLGAFVAGILVGESPILTRQTADPGDRAALRARRGRASRRRS